MTSNELRRKYIEFFKSKGHSEIKSASLIPENDPSVLFTTAGMHPLIPYLLGEKHPSGVRLVDSQKCVRTGDIDDVGDNRHLTFFEMLGNWSLGDYFKKESIEFSFEFLTDKEKGLGLDPKRLYFTVFKGEAGISRDNDAIEIWKNILEKNNLDNEIASDDEIIKDKIRIIPLGVDDNLWTVGKTGPCGTDTEVFYDTKPEDGVPNKKFGELVDDFRFIEIWNNVFMEFNRTENGEYIKLKNL
ncbi:MAG: alanine--tRNA ligase-related protein, partial [Candidatus Staskawiczbacteria bacterium]